MTATERYWYSILFPLWLRRNYVKLYIWKQKLAVVIQLHSLTENSFFPTNLELMLFDEDGNLVQDSVISRYQDNIIQLKRFKVLRDTKIIIKIILNDMFIVENLNIN